MGLKIPNVLYPIPYMFLFFILMPFTSWTSHGFAVLFGILYSTKALDIILLSSRQLNALDTTSYLSWISNSPSFVMKPGEVGLPIPGSFPAPYFMINQKFPEFRPSKRKHRLIFYATLKCVQIRQIPTYSIL